jgi:CheY-like chemotaxis protein
MKAAYVRSPAVQQDLGSGSLHILIVDDHPETLLLLRHVLKKIGTIETAADLDEALRKAKKNRFDLFLIDIYLNYPEAGLHLLHKLREQSVYSKTPVIACTAYALPGDRKRLLREGFDGYISKPFTRRDVMQEIARVYNTEKLLPLN